MSPSIKLKLPVLKAIRRPPMAVPAPSATPAPGAAAASPVIAGSRTRPLWFDGRFLAAQDVEREQFFFLRRQAELGRAGGFGVIHGLMVDRGAQPGQTPESGTIVIHAGVGVTPGGSLVMLRTDLTIHLSDLPDEQNLNEKFGLDATPQQPARTRTGVYVIGLRPAQFTANPVSSYPANLQDARVTRDGDVIEATAVTLIPYPNPVNQYDAGLQQAALARQIFVGGAAGAASDSVLPLAMAGIDRDEIQWIDCYLARRDNGPQYEGVTLGLADTTVQQAFLLQYDAMLRSIVAAHPTAAFQAIDYFQALPPAGRFPLACINASNFTQTFFPQQMNVQLSAIPADELPAVLEDSLSLAPIDLTLVANYYSNLSVHALVPIPRASFASQQSSLPPTPLSPLLPAAAATRQPIRLLQLLPKLPPLPTTTPPPATTPPPTGWPTTLAGQTYGFYALRRNQPVFVDFSTVFAGPTTTTPAPTTTPPPTTTPGPTTTAH
jgi:hypothetical protein